MRLPERRPAALAVGGHAFTPGPSPGPEAVRVWRCRRCWVIVADHVLREGFYPRPCPGRLRVLDAGVPWRERAAEHRRYRIRVERAALALASGVRPRARDCEARPGGDPRALEVAFHVHGSIMATADRALAEAFVRALNGPSTG